MEANSNTEAMRALSKLYRIEAERMESSESPEIAVLKAQLRAVQSSREAMNRKIRDGALRAPSRSGVSHEKAWKILTVTFALTGLLGFFAALFFTGPDNSIAPSPLEPLHIPASGFTPSSAPKPDRIIADEKNIPDAVPVKAEKPPKKPRVNHAGSGGKPRRENLGKHEKEGTTKPPKDDFTFFDKCGMDPMCGFDKKSK